MSRAIVSDNFIVAVGSSAMMDIEVPDKMPVTPGWTWNDKQGFRAPPPPFPWMLDVLNGVRIYKTTVWDMTKAPSEGEEFPIGINLTVVDNVRMYVETRTGLVELKSGDQLVKCSLDEGDDAQLRIGISFNEVQVIKKQQQ